MELAGKVSLVTGGAHRVGKALALALAQAGTHVVVHYGSSEEEAHQTADEISALGVAALPVQADLTDLMQIEALFKAVKDRFGRLDVLVNSASNFLKQSFDSIRPEDWDRAMQVNLRAPFLCTQLAARLMQIAHRPADQPAAIINIADLMGMQPRRNFVQHGVSKAGLIHLTLTTAYELAPDIRVNAIVPGPILAPAGMDPSSEQWRRIGERVPLGRAGHPDNVAEAVVFLARNDYITGAVLPIDGGEHLIGSPT